MSVYSFFHGGAALTALLIAALLAAAPAQSLDDLSAALGDGKGAGAMGGLPSLDEAGASTIAGVLQYCIKNNYLGGADKAAGSSLVGKLTGSGQARKDSTFQAGSKGPLDTSGGEAFGLGGSGPRARITDQVCDMVLKHAGLML